MPAVPRTGLGVGLDLPHGRRAGLLPTAAGPRVDDRVVSFLRRYAQDFRTLFVSWQPGDRGVLDAARDAAPLLDLFAQAPAYVARGLHHTALNTGAPRTGARDDVLAFTAELVERCGFAWVNEDLGIWSLAGRPLPYPQPPILTTAGLRACVRNVDKVQRALPAPFVVEFPGITDGATVVFGALDAYDHFKTVVERTGSPCTLDTGHLLGWRWLQGHRGEALYGDLDRLPLDSCFEVHLSGCSIVGDAFTDAHHGVLLDEQLVLLERLLPRCPRACVVTYEDPRFDDDGALIEKARPGFERLRAIVGHWLDANAAAAPANMAVDAARAGSARASVALTGTAHDAATALEDVVARCLRDAPFRAQVAAGDVASLDEEARAALTGIDAARADVAGAAIVREVRARRHRGTGSLEDVYADVLRPHDEPARRALFARYVASAAYRSDAPDEEAFARFLIDDERAAPGPVDAGLLRAVTRALAVHGTPAFPLPPSVMRRPRGWVVVAQGAAGPSLFAAIDGRAIEGPIDDVTAAVIRASSRGEALDAARRSGLDDDSAHRLVAAVIARGFVDRGGSDGAPESAPSRSV